ncbi:methyltransferase domain-containing protein [Paenibacillus sp. 7124]|uniref:Methyltransferase domain-containing protein n=1 Tax=Paenibacillus apii TaxID=1850370 RepID=A0A6M1PJM8_9BACL|nr:class I SAM-dependent methyltransferase [Paenibacillus apii]NGM82568.1 methyltransferase domain-containing protein [Paenibacillus apii]
MESVIRYYDGYDEASRLIRDNTGKLEFITTVHILDKYISKDHQILDVGAGTGIYSFYYAEKGQPVVSTDLSPKHVEIIQDKITSGGYSNMIAERTDATDLSKFEPGSFDAVFCLGPMYHLTDQTDQRKCISECLRVLRPGGILAVAYINRFFILPYLVKNDSGYLTDQWVAKFLEQGGISSADEDCFWTDAYFHTPEEIEQLLGDQGVSKLDHAAADGIGVIMKDTVNRFSKEQFDSWVNYHLRTCSEPSILGISNHGLYVGRK